MLYSSQGLAAIAPIVERRHFTIASRRCVPRNILRRMAPFLRMLNGPPQING